jgi:hypothetical protein
MLSNTLRKHRLRISLLSALALAISVPAAWAQSWNERTELTFSDPVMIPGATLQPGTYIFRLTDSQSSRHIVEIAKEDGETVTVTQAVPTKRKEAKGDVVVKFNPTEAGTPPAIAAWFYPGSVYGHQFVYPDDQAKKIAERTRTLVLSTDVPGTDLEKGRLRVYDASGVAKDWQPDADAAASYEAWQRDRRATAGVVTGQAGQDRAQATAPMIDADFKGTRLSVDALESDPKIYLGQKVSVDANVERVYGPRMFTIDEPNWADLDGEILVYVPTSLAALVREDDKVTVRGTVKSFVQAELEDQWGWLDLDDADEVTLQRRPVLVATHIVGGNDNRALVIDVNQGATNRANAAADDATPVGTSGTSGTAGGGFVTDLTDLARGDDDMVGRHVKLENVRIESKADDKGFFTRVGDEMLFVLPAPGETTALTQGTSVSLDGVILQMPRHMREHTEAPGDRPVNDDIYVYATKVKR